MENTVSTATNTTTLQINLAGKRALVTGGTRGIGKGITDRLRAAGATVLAAARSVPHTPLPQVITADIATAGGSATVAERTLAILGGVDIVVHNVGGSEVKAGSMTSLTDDDWHQAFQMNLFGAVRLDRALVPSMIDAHGGVIIHITSVQRRQPMPGTAPYAAAKAALSNYSKALSNELASDGIRVNSVCPGFIETEAAKVFVDQHSAAQQISTDAARAQIIESVGGIPLGRTGDPTDVGDLVAFLVSDRARYLTGTEYLIDGGSTRTV
jgi:NAD(P)-dependent dehydrogenase (short-subunit alcohol dehydrogenase family)